MKIIRNLIILFIILFFFPAFSIEQSFSNWLESFKKIGSLVSAAPIMSSGSLYILTEKPSIIGFN